MIICALAALAPAVLVYVRDEGIASPLLTTRPQWLVALAFVPAVALAAIGEGPQGALVVLGALVAGVAVLALARLRIGGFTGDTLGAGGLVAETIGLLAAVAVLRP